MTKIFNVVYYSTVKNEVMSFAGKWMKLEMVISSKIKPDSKAYFTFSLTSKTNIF